MGDRVFYVDILEIEIFLASLTMTEQVVLKLRNKQAIHVYESKDLT